MADVSPFITFDVDQWLCNVRRQSESDPDVERQHRPWTVNNAKPSEWICMQTVFSFIDPTD